MGVAEVGFEPLREYHLLAGVRRRVAGGGWRGKGIALGPHGRVGHQAILHTCWIVFQTVFRIVELAFAPLDNHDVRIVAVLVALRVVCRGLADVGRQYPIFDVHRVEERWRAFAVRVDGTREVPQIVPIGHDQKQLIRLKSLKQRVARLAKGHLPYPAIGTMKILAEQNLCPGVTRNRGYQTGWSGSVIGSNSFRALALQACFLRMNGLPALTNCRAPRRPDDLALEIFHLLRCERHALRPQLDQRNRSAGRGH